MQTNENVGMKWYKFVIYVQLFLSALVSVGTGIMYLTGSHYGDSSTASAVYAYYGFGLRILDIVMGICMFAIAVACILVRQKLRNFKKDGPAFYLMVLVVNCVLPVIYLLLVALLTGLSIGSIANSSTVTSLVTSAVLILVNRVYFNKRAGMFTEA